MASEVCSGLIYILYSFIYYLNSALTHKRLINMNRAYLARWRLKAGFPLPVYFRPFVGGHFLCISTALALPVYSLK